MFNSKKIATTLVISSSMILGACSDSKDKDVDDLVEEQTQDVSIAFAAQVNGTDFACGTTFTGVGTGGDDFTVSDFRMYVHDMHIHDELTGEEYEIELTQDGVWQLDDIAMLDFENGANGCSGTAETNSVVQGEITVPATIDLASAEICFEVGVPTDMNHLDKDTADSPLNASGMQWAWKVGYKYIKIDGVGDPTGANENFNLHLGAQGCPGATATAPPDSACTQPNTFEVCIDNFDVENSVIAVDPAFVFENNDVAFNLNGGATAKPGCQSFIDDDDCEEIMPRLGLDYDYGRSGTGVKSTYTAGQKMFSKQ